MMKKKMILISCHASIMGQMMNTIVDKTVRKIEPQDWDQSKILIVDTINGLKRSKFVQKNKRNFKVIKVKNR